MWFGLFNGKLTALKFILDLGLNYFSVLQAYISTPVVPGTRIQHSILKTLLLLPVYNFASTLKLLI